MIPIGSRHSFRLQQRKVPCNRSIEIGKLNPKAPSELSRFAFLIGKWRFEAKVKLPGGKSAFSPIVKSNEVLTCCEMR